MLSVRWQGSGYIFVVAANIRTVGVVRGFSSAAFLSVLASVSGSSFLGKP
ncbi:hypothetical protein [Photobacterium sanguinicancri]